MKKQGLHHSSVELWFHVIIWCHPGSAAPLFLATLLVIRSADCSAIVFLHVNFNVAFCLISNFKQRVHGLVTRLLRVHRHEKS